MNSLMSSLITQQPGLLANDTALDAFLNDDNSANSTGFDALLDSISGISTTKNVAQTAQSAGSLLSSGLSLSTITAIFGFDDASTDTTLYPATLKNRAELEAAIGSSGPLPNYLRMLVAGHHLNAEQTQSLYEITARHMDIVPSPESIQELAEELTKAGIS